MIARRARILRGANDVSLRMTVVKKKETAAGSPLSAERTGGERRSKR
jgi:hypothetical protein